MKAWFSSEPTRLEALRLALADNTPRVRVLYATCEPFPTREEAEAKLAAAEILRDEYERERERARQPRVVPMRVGSVR